MIMRKLRSRRGMSIIMGLLLLLVCVTAGAAALTAAASNVGRYTHLRQDQQRYLAVASATRLVRDELCKGQYTASASLTETYIHYTTSSTNAETGEVTVTWHTRGPEYTMDENAAGSYTGNGFGPWLEERLKKLFQANEVESNWWSLSGRTATADPGPLQCSGLGIQVDGADSQVKWELTMGENYTLTARFWLEETDKNGKVSTYYATTLTIPAKVTFSETTTHDNSRYETNTITTRTMSVTWPVQDAVIQQN